MKTYTIDETDLALLSDHAGAFNSSRVGKPVTTRWDCSVNWAKADRLGELVKRLKAPDEEQPAPPVETPPSGMVPLDVGPSINSSPIPLTFNPGRAQAFHAEVAGNGSASIEEGGAGLYAAVLSAPLPSAVSISSFTTWGAKAVFGLALSPGQFLVVYSQAATVLAGRADVR